MVTPKKADGRKNNKGGVRVNAGRKQRTTQETKGRLVHLTDSEYNYLVFKHGGFTAAVRTLLEVGWEFDDL